MNDKFTNNMNSDDENIVRKLNQVAEETSINAQFASELEESLRAAHQPKAGWFVSSFRQISPTLRLAALMILLALVLSWSIKTLIPAPQPAANNTPAIFDVTTPTPAAVTSETATPITQGGGYDWRGAKLYLAAPLPESPADANILLLRLDQHATVEEARALAQQFGIEGEIYQTPGELPDTTDYMVTDGKQRLYVRSKNYFTYYADYSLNISLLGIKEISDEEAHAAVDTFLKSHGFDFEYQIEKETGTPGIYYVLLLTPDGHGIRFDYNMPSRLQMTIGNEGQVISVDSSQIEYEPVGTFGIRSAEEAFQQVLGSADTIQMGIMESAHSGGVLNESYWERSFPENQTITIYGQVTVLNAVDPSKQAFTAINSYTATGNAPPASSDQLIEATGQFHTENGIRKFNVESWKVSNATETAVMGTLRREGDQFILLSDMDEEYVVTDVPADVPLNTVIPDEMLLVNGVLANGDLVWTSIQYFPEGSNYGSGGGGGGGTGFYQLNLSGTPVPFPSPTSQSPIPYTVREGDTCGGLAVSFGVSVQSIVTLNSLPANCIISVGQTLFIPGQQTENPYEGRRFEKQRGTVVINVYNKADGSTRNEFVFTSKDEDGSLLYALLEDVSLESLLAYHNRPIDIWGTVKYVDKFGLPVISVEKYETPYPGLTFQIVQGTQKNVEIGKTSVTLFITEDGKNYVQMSPDGSLSGAIVGDIGDKVSAEALFIPDETFEGFPTVRLFNMGMAFNPKNGEPTTITITADQPHAMDGAIAPEDYVAPDATIEKVELVYHIADPRYVPLDANAGPQYIQPVWRFHGHYSNGDEFEILVQALKQEYLLPEIETHTPPG
jgi:LysM repeat protein